MTFTLSGQQETFDLVAGDSILEGALQVRSDAPYSCMGGACGTCRAKLLDGTVEMDQNFALGARRARRRLRPDLPVASDQPDRVGRLRRLDA